jgi:hypothetical protein
MLAIIAQNVRDSNSASRTCPVQRSVPPFGFVSELWSAVSTAIDKARLSCFIFAQTDWLKANTRWQRWLNDCKGESGPCAD